MMTSKNDCAVYHLDVDNDDPRVEGLALATYGEPSLLQEHRGHEIPSRLTDFLPSRPYQPNWEPLRLAEIWKPLRVVGRVRAWNDYPTLMSWPAFSRRAIDALHDMLEPNGELLPLLYEHGEYWVYNVRTVVDIVNLDVSIHSMDETTRLQYFPVTEIEHYEIYPERLHGLSIFRMRQDPSGTYVTQPFVDRVRSAGLRNFVFEKIAPWPKGTNWITEVSKQRRAAREAKRKAGVADLRGNTVVLRLVTGENKMPNKQQREHVGVIMDSLDALLADPNAAYDAPVYGNLAGDEPVKGEHRLFLNCPDADRLVAHLKPWLHYLDWPGPIVVVKRYGELYDENAREETLQGPW